MNQHPNYTKLVVLCITCMGMSAAAGGCWLLWKGFAGGGELVVTLNTAISGLVGFLGGRQSAQQPGVSVVDAPPPAPPVQHDVV